MPLPRGRPRGSKDRGTRKRRAEPLDLARCKLDLLKIMLYTRDLAADGWRVDDHSRFLFAHTRGFGEWNRSRKVDSLALQMRTWLQRDIVPVVEATRLFSRTLPPDFFPERRATANAFLVQIAAWLHGGGQLDCLLTPMYQQLAAPSAALEDNTAEEEERALIVVHADASLLPPWVESGARIWHEQRKQHPSQRARRRMAPLRRLMLLGAAAAAERAVVVAVPSSSSSSDHFGSDDEHYELLQRLWDDDEDEATTTTTTTIIEDQKRAVP